MSVKVVVLNCTNFYPTSIDVDDQRIGEGPVRMLGGALRFWHRAYKKKWSLHWENVIETIVPALRTEFRTSTAFTYVDQDSTSYQVVTTSYKETILAEQISLAGYYYYNVDLEFEES